MISKRESGQTAMGVTRIISSGSPGAESAALDAAIRFRIPYGGFTHQGALLPNDRPTGRYRLDERPYVPAMLLLEANLAQADGLLTFAGGALPAFIARVALHAREQGQPHLHLDTAQVDVREAPFRIARWSETRETAVLCITGTSLRDDRLIYAYVHDALSAFFLMIQGGPTAAAPPMLH
jgi:hypothetical protein